MLKKWYCIMVYSLMAFISVGIVSCNNEPDKKVEIRGIYGHPQPLWDKGHKLSDLGVNAIFVHSGSIDDKMMQRAREEGMKIYAEFATLNGKGYVEENIEAWAVNEKGEHVEAATWFMGVCPTEPGFRQYRYELLHNLLTEYDIDGVWMDYVHWHAQFEDPEPILPETCFCENCLSAFSSDKNIKVPVGSTSQKSEWIMSNHDVDWRNWRCEIIAGWAADMRKIVDEVKPGTLLGIYHCPWTDDEFDGARRRILGIDYDLLTQHVDVFSPMVYHARMGRNPEWVAENIRWFSSRIDSDKGNMPKIWPIVQAYDNPYQITANEFETVLLGGLSANATGVMMFTTRAIAENEEKVAVLKKNYDKLSKQ